MKIALFGATGGTGRQVLAQAIAGGHSVKALVRDPTKLSSEDGLSLVPGHMHDAASIARALEGADAAIVALGTTNRKANTELSDATRLILAEMAKAGVARSSWVTSIGCGDSLPKLKRFIFRELIVKRLAKEIWADKNRQEALIQASSGAWTIMRPGGLRDEPAHVVPYQVIEGGAEQPTLIVSPRACVADFLLKAVQDEAQARRTVCLFV
jgi:putative NADH-flavin reductase